MQKLKIKAKYLQAVLILILAIILFNPFNTAKYGLLFLSIYIFANIFNKKILNIVINNIQFWFLFLFCFLYSTIQLSYQFIRISNFIMYLFFPLIFYIFGLVIITKIKNEKQITYYLYAVIISLSLFGVFATVYSMQIYGTVAGIDTRIAIIPWMKETKLLGGTGMGIYVSLGISLSGLLFIKTNLFIKGLNALIFLTSLYSSIVLANRTGLIIAVISVILVYFTDIRLNYIRNNIKTTFLFVAQCILLIFLFNMNLFNIKRMWLQSNAFKRFTNTALSNDDRFTLWGEAFKGLFTNPLGGKQTQLLYHGYSHNLWLDIGWTTGLFPFVLFVVFTLMTLKEYIKLLQNEDMSLYFKYLITTMLCGFILTFMVEPVIEANILYFCAFCFVSGVIRSINKRIIIRSFKNLPIDKGDL